MQTTSQGSLAAARPFTQAEMQRRWRAVGSVLKAQGLDGLIATQNSSFMWLTTHNAAGNYMLPYVMVVTADGRGEAIVREYDTAAVEADAPGLAVSAYRYLDDFGSAVASALQRLGLQSSRVGMELGGWGLAPADVTAIQSAVPGLTVVDGTAIVAELSDVKSAEELIVVRKAAEFADRAMLTLIEELREGVSEAQVEQKVAQVMRDVGAGDPPNGVLGIGLGFGIRGTYPHSVASGYRLQQQDVVWTERGGFFHNYCAGILRTAVLGSNPHVEDLYKIALEATQETMAVMKPGTSCAAVHATAQSALRKHGIEQNYRTGYSIGINWWTRGHGTLEPAATVPLVPGNVFHIPRVLVKDGHFAVSVSETMLITETGSERLSTLPTDIYYV